MPWKAKRPCSRQGCNLLVGGASRFCPEHEKQSKQQYDAQRGTAADRGYNAGWAKVRVMKLNIDCLCQRCLMKNVDKSACLVHHKDRNSGNNSMDNLESLCLKCHQKEHEKEIFRKG
jgi:5-methylcytosine-specific restriction protein A